MKKIWFDNEEVIEILEQYNIYPICGLDMGLYVSDNEVERICDILHEHGCGDLYCIES